MDSFNPSVHLQVFIIDGGMEIEKLVQAPNMFYVREEEGMKERGMKASKGVRWQMEAADWKGRWTKRTGDKEEHKQTPGLTLPSPHAHQGEGKWT